VGTSTADPLADALEICERHGRLFIKVDTDRVWDRDANCYRYPRCWKVFRKLPGGRSAFLGQRRDPAQLLLFVRKLV
jgi:hypothetical protein